MKTILFVDDEPDVLTGLRRVLRPMRHKWKMLFAKSGIEALDIMDQAQVDIIVSDMRMPLMDGAQLLSRIKELMPQTVRIILSGHSDPEMILRSVEAAHQFLAKPCDAEDLVDKLEKACALSDLLLNTRLKSLISGMKTLPSLPNLYMEIVALLKSDDASINRIGEIVEKDIGMTAKVLQLVNSAFFGLPRHVSDVKQAVSLLGMETIKSLVLAMQVFSQFDTRILKRLHLNDLWVHSMEVAVLARLVALESGADKSTGDDAFMAGNMHDLGKLVLAVNQPEKYGLFVERAKPDGYGTPEMERDVFGAVHPEVGAYLLGLWGIPDAIIQAVAFHHAPKIPGNKKFNAMLAVHVADYLAHEGKAPGHIPASPNLIPDVLPIPNGGNYEDFLERCRQKYREITGQ